MANLLSNAFVRRLWAVVKWAEAQPNGPSNRREGRPRGIPYPGMYLCKADEDIASGETGTVSIWKGFPGEEEDTGHNLEPVSAALGDVAADEFIWVASNGGYWHVVQGGGSAVRLALLSETLTQGGTADAELLDGDGATTGTVVSVKDFLMQSGDEVSADSKIYIAKINGVWQLVSAACPVE